MKKNQILAAFALAFALGLFVMPTTYAEEAPVTAAAESEPESATGESTTVETDDTSASEVEETPVSSGTSEDTDGSTPSTHAGASITVSNETDLKHALEDPLITEITVDSNITVSTPIVINRLPAAGESYAPTAIVDLGGNTISAGTGVNTVFRIEDGSISFRNGTIDASGVSGGIAIRMYGHPTANSGETYVYVDSDVTIKAGEGSSAYGVAIFPAAGTNSAYGTILSMSGTIDAPTGNGITIHGNIKDKTTGESSQDTSYPFVNVSGNINAPSDTGIYAAGYSSLYIGAGATVSGATGITIKSGVLNVDNGATVEGTGTPATGVPASSGAAATGAGIQVESNSAVYASEVTISIFDGATVKSANNSAIYQYSAAGSDEAIKELRIGENAIIESAEGKANIEGVSEDRIVTIAASEMEPGKGEALVEKDTTAATKPGNLGVVAESAGSARSTANVLAAIATAITTVGIGAVVYRNLRRHRHQRSEVIDIDVDQTA